MTDRGKVQDHISAYWDTGDKGDKGDKGDEGPRGFANCKKVLADIKVKRTKVAKGQSLTFGVRLINRSDGDIDNGRWFMVLPPGISFISSSRSLQNNNNGILSLDPIDIYSKGHIQFTINLRVATDASGRLTIRSFLEDFEDYCEASDALTLVVEEATHWFKSKKNSMMKRLFG